MRRNDCLACKMIEDGVKSRKALPHTCGLVLSNDGPISHKWLLGKWEGNTKTDTCIICGCERHSIRFKRHGMIFSEVSSYTRSHIHYNKESRPPCWGAKNPQ